MNPLTSEEFEHLQLKAHMAFCRRCGLAEEQAIPMEHIDIVELEITGQQAPGADQGQFHAHLYVCRRCGHRALSEAYREDREEEMPATQEWQLAVCPSCKAEIAFIPREDVDRVTLACQSCSTVFEVERPREDVS